MGPLTHAFYLFIPVYPQVKEALHKKIREQHWCMLSEFYDDLKKQGLNLPPPTIGRALPGAEELSSYIPLELSLSWLTGSVVQNIYEFTEDGAFVEWDRLEERVRKDSDNSKTITAKLQTVKGQLMAFLELQDYEDWPDVIDVGEV